ncbi:hypothetical protein GOP47_0020915 [Adiantum capillus-veneris]|uniref:Uncharacterized protein n=1 Tax=Adiantum capillus-veneris TaxID=13818 RepID=A0A9D4UAL1_ADICA|nr:hypothetical protein GOP47_0020915 [Adiantum capillus-veneris]
MARSSKPSYAKAVSGKEKPDTLKAIEPTGDLVKPGAEDRGQSSLTNMSKEELKQRKTQVEKDLGGNPGCTVIEQKVARGFGVAGGCC